MATTLTPVSSSSRGFRFGRFLAYALLALLAVIVAGILWAYSIARSALPQLDGAIAVSGLSSPVTVIRDSHGVPTIDAINLADLFFAQGYITAQDRLWQMDGMRRYAAGELSEILGPDFVKQDREQRILGMRLAARKAAELATEPTRSYFEAYARGVNAFISYHQKELPIEFRILRYSPQRWTPEDSYLIAAQMVKDLNHGQFEDQLVREKILAKLGPELTADLFVNSSWHDRPPTTPRPSIEDIPDKDAPSKITYSLPFPMPGSANDSDPRPALGSNNWVVSGDHTTTGKPLLSNDMHLGHQMPNLWYEAHLHSGNFDVAGVTLPGLPFVVVGHNQWVAWGFTNVGPTVEDVYIETFNDSGQYLTPDGWKDVEHRQEVIHVKNAADITMDVALTRHGPIITELVPGETRKLALRWTLYDGVHNPFFDVNSAQNWNEFATAFSHFDAPGQNVVYADVEGNIAYHTTGKIPIRAAGDGSLPVDGSDNAHEWTGFVPFDQLPSIFNPPWGVVATANGRITPDAYPHSLSAEWEAPWRTSRIYRVLESGKKFSAADMLALQMDVYSEFDRFCAERFVYSVDHASKASARAKQAAEILRSWDGRMTSDSAAPTLAYRARGELMRLLLEPKLGTAPSDPQKEETTFNWKSYRWEMQTIWLENVMLRRPARWLPENYANYDDLLTAAVEAAVTDPAAPPELASWKWGSYRPLDIQHPILGKIPLLNRWTGPGVQPQSGSGYTVKAVTRHHGPSERMTVDLSNLDASTLNLVTGQGGNFLSPYYMDQWKAWYDGTTFRLPFTRAAVQESGTHKLILQPAK